MRGSISGDNQKEGDKIEGEIIKGSERENELGLLIIYGYCLITVGFVFFTWCIYSMIISKLLPYTNNILLDMIKDDTFYCFLIPLSIPIIYFSIYWNWICMKYFKHN